MLSLAHIPLYDPSAFVAAGNRVRFLASDLGLSRIEAARLAIAASELCRKAYAEEGEASFTLGLSMPPSWCNAPEKMGGMAVALETSRKDVDISRLRCFFHGLQIQPLQQGLQIEGFYAAQLPDFHPDESFRRREQARFDRHILPTRAELKHMATHDGLTAVYNRAFFQEKLEEEVRRTIRYSTPLSLLMIDIDYFKVINDTHGHQTGDACLISVAAMIRRLPRKVDTVARYGGEEFAVILPHTEMKQALHLAERIRQAAESMEVQSNGQAIRFTVSIGVGNLDADESLSPDALIRAADQALYAAKESGRNRVCTSRMD